MKDVTIHVKAGALRGRSFECEVGRVVIGRQPPEGGFQLQGSDTSVSRVHAELVEDGPDIVLKNLSPNGSRVNGEVILESVVLQPQDEIGIGNQYVFVLDWATFTAAATDQKKDTEADKESLLTTGPLASPIVRAVLVVYLLGIVGVAGYFIFTGGEPAVAADVWPDLELAYTDYLQGSVPSEQAAERLRIAGNLVREVRSLKTRGLYREIQPMCRELMRLDEDTRSPVYRYGASCLGELVLE